MQLPAHRRNPHRWRAGPAERGDLQRGLAAAVDRAGSATSTRGRCRRTSRHHHLPGRSRRRGDAQPPLAAEAQLPTGATPTDPDRRADRHHGAVGRWIVIGIRWRRWRYVGLVVLAVFVLTSVSGCGWRGLNSLALPGTAGAVPGRSRFRLQLPDVTNLQQNSRVRVGDVTVGNVTHIERQALARAGHSSARRRRRTYRRTRPPNSDRPACWARCTLNSHHRRTSRPRASFDQGSLIPSVLGWQLSDDGGDPGGGLTTAQRWRAGPASRHHQGVEHSASTVANRT